MDLATHIISESYLSPFFDDNERKDLRSITNVFNRKEEILKRVSKLTNGQITLLEQMGHPPSILSCEDRKLFKIRMKKRLQRVAEQKLLLACYYQGEMISAFGAMCWNPVEFLSNPLLYVDKEQDAVSFLTYQEMNIFAQQFLYGIRFQEIRELIKPTEIVFAGPIGILFSFRGGGMGSAVQYIGMKYFDSLGYKFVFGYCGTPITAYYDVRDGWTPYQEISFAFCDLIWKNEKPFESVTFLSKIPNGDNLHLCVYAYLKKLIQIGDEKNILQTFTNYKVRSAL